MPFIGQTPAMLLDIDDDAITSAKIVTDAVGASEIAANAVGSSEVNLANDYNFTEIQNLSDEELKLIKKLISYPYLLYQSSYYNEPHRLINYLEEISSDFHSIWNKGKDNESLRFINEKNTEKTISKIFWLESFRIVLKDIFSIIDISAPETM